MIWPVPTQVGKTVKQFTGLFYGWRMVAAASALRVLGAGLHSYGFTVFFLPLSHDLNLNRTSTSLAFSLARAAGGPCRRADRRPPARPLRPQAGHARGCALDGHRLPDAFEDRQLHDV